MDIRQLRDYVVRPALERINAWTPNAEQLVIGTALAESRAFFIHQVGRGPARGFFQMEPVTHDDIWERYLSRRPALLNELKGLIMRDMDLHDQLHGNLFYAAAMCRIFYLRFKEPLPEMNDWPGMAAYWKKYYNTPAGAGTVEGFIQKARPAFDLYVGGIND
ncbi:MAG TPA: hypothetical protein PK513_03965 [Alphaproteobacteria bacterium]|nr:hypothetical protein [Alphaproteobacteria bacterium]USO05702.1 MAG: hypothetical protein H6859_00400 [Rhodospirillales bacterium]HOO81639.1 hypothetical protein [Alphaproteobacteria bacterium]